MQEDLFQRGNAQMWDAEGTEGDMIVLDLGRIVDDTLSMHSIEDGLYIGHTLAVAAHKAFKDEIESGDVCHSALVIQRANLQNF